MRMNDKRVDVKAIVKKHADKIRDLKQKQADLLKEFDKVASKAKSEQLLKSIKKDDA